MARYPNVTGREDPSRESLLLDPSKKISDSWA
jgi:hypothetical protein